MLLAVLGALAGVLALLVRHAELALRKCLLGRRLSPEAVCLLSLGHGRAGRGVSEVGTPRDGWLSAPHQVSSCL